MSNMDFDEIIYLLEEHMDDFDLEPTDVTRAIAILSAVQQTNLDFVDIMEVIPNLSVEGPVGHA
jgi:hypothetical protein